MGILSLTSIINAYNNSGGVDGSYSTFTSNSGDNYKPQNAYNNSLNTSTSARLQLKSNSSNTVVSAMWYRVNTNIKNNLPSNAIIKQVICKIRYHVSSTSYVSALSIQLYNGSTPMGDPITNRSTTSSVYYFSNPGTWTVQDLNTNRPTIEIKATHSKSTYGAYVYISGADFTVYYEVPSDIKLLKFNGTTTNNITYNGQNVNKLIYNGNTVFQKDPKEYYKTIPLTFEILTSGDIKLERKSSSGTKSWTMTYSINGGSQTTVTGNTTTTKTIASVNAGDIFTIHSLSCLWSSGNLLNGASFSYFSTTCQFNVYGNLVTTMNSGNMASHLCFGLFYNCTNLISAENLILHDTELGLYCYSVMFYGCTSLTTAPDLPSMTLANDCYRAMFSECTSLTTAPDLPAPITSSGEEYDYMFYDCSNLNYIKCLANFNISSISNNITQPSFTSNVSSTGTFVKLSCAKWISGTSGIPIGWTIEEI